MPATPSTVLMLTLARDDCRRKVHTFPKRAGNIAQNGLNPQNLSVDLLNCAFAPLRYVVIRDNLQGVSNVVIQFRDPKQPVLQRLVAFLDVRQNPEYRYAGGQSDCGSSQHQRHSGKVLACHEPIQYPAAEEY